MRRPLIVVAVLLALLVAGLVVVRLRTGESKAEGSTAPNQPTVETLQQGQAPPVAVETSAHAAVAAVAMTGDVVHAGFISRRELIESFTTPSFGPTLADETSAQMSALLVELNQRDADLATMQVNEQPLRVRTTSTTTTAATVEVWSVLVVAPPGAGTARVMWRTVTLDMQLVDGRWLVDGWESVPGPTPMTGSDSRVSSAADVAAVLAWAPVGSVVA